MVFTIETRPMNTAALKPGVGATQTLMRAFVIAWACCTLFYFFEYAVRSAPAVMLPELAKLFGLSALGVSSLLGVYYYTYALLSLIAGLLLDRYGARYVVAAGALVLGV